MSHEQYEAVRNAHEEAFKTLQGTLEKMTNVEKAELLDRKLLSAISGGHLAVVCMWAKWMINQAHLSSLEERDPAQSQFLRGYEYGIRDFLKYIFQSKPLEILQPDPSEDEAPQEFDVFDDRKYSLDPKIEEEPLW